MKCVIYPKAFLVVLLTCTTLCGCSVKEEDDFKNSQEYNNAMQVISEEVSKGILEQQTCTQVPNTTGGKLSGLQN